MDQTRVSPISLSGLRCKLCRVGAIAWRGALLVGWVWVMAGAGCKKAAPPAEETPVAPAASSAASGGGSSAGGSLADRLKAVESGAADKPAADPMPDWKPMPAGAAGVPVPIQTGLKVTTAIKQPIGDYESFKTLTEVTPATVTMTYFAAQPDPKGPPTTSGEPQLKKVTCGRQIDAADLKDAHAYSEIFCGKVAMEHYPKTTAISVSTEVLNQLRTGQPVDFNYVAGEMTQIMQMFGGGAGKPVSAPHPGQVEGMTYCQMKRVEATDLAFPVLFNDQPVTLPALHAMCTVNDQQDVNLYVLDEPANPLALAWQIDRSRLQVIRITLPPPPPAAGGGAGAGKGGGGGGGGGSAMEQALAAKKPVEVYGIYFDFNSSVIKPESEVVLRQISEIMHKNPDWKLSVSGHTDNVGDGDFNAALSQRRAAAVKSALVSEFKIAPERLDTAGYGASQPIADNKTLEGRARNRRVELQRE